MIGDGKKTEDNVIGSKVPPSPGGQELLERMTCELMFKWQGVTSHVDF